MTLTASQSDELVFETKARHLPQPTPADWHIETLEDGKVKVRIASELLIKHDAYRDNPIKAAGQFPTGFEPSKLYNAAISRAVYKPPFLPPPMRLNQRALNGILF